MHFKRQLNGQQWNTFKKAQFAKKLLLNQGRYNCKISIFQKYKNLEGFFIDIILHVAKFSI